jgi:hypothetical protein
MCLSSVRCRFVIVVCTSSRLTHRCLRQPFGAGGESSPEGQKPYGGPSRVNLQHLHLGDIAELHDFVQVLEKVLDTGKTISMGFVTSSP